MTNSSKYLKAKLIIFSSFKFTRLEKLKDVIKRRNLTFINTNTTNNELPAYLQFSPDGNLLVSMTHKGTTDPINEIANGGVGISVYQLDNSSEDRSLNYVKTINNATAQQLMSMQFGTANDGLYYTNATTTAGHKLQRLSLTTGTTYTYGSDLLDRTAVVRTAAGDLYTATSNGTALQAITADALVADAITLPADYSLTGSGQSTQLHSISSPQEEQLYFAREVGLKQYELKDHLGNVRAVVSDRLYSTTDAGGNKTYSAGVVSATDYYAFGMSMPGRSYNNAEYRYGFNGKEKDQNGEFGSNTTYDYGFRIYNPSIAKFLSVDPLTKSFPSWTPYAYSMDRPIDGIDLDGLERVHYQVNTKKSRTGETITTLSYAGTQESRAVEVGWIVMNLPLSPEVVLWKTNTEVLVLVIGLTT